MLWITTYAKLFGGEIKPSKRDHSRLYKKLIYLIKFLNTKKSVDEPRRCSSKVTKKL